MISFCIIAESSFLMMVNRWTIAQKQGSFPPQQKVSLQWVAVCFCPLIPLQSSALVKYILNNAVHQHGCKVESFSWAEILEGKHQIYCWWKKSCTTSLSNYETLLKNRTFWKYTCQLVNRIPSIKHYIVERTGCQLVIWIFEEVPLTKPEERCRTLANSNCGKKELHKVRYIFLNKAR